MQGQLRLNVMIESEYKYHLCVFFFRRFRRCFSWNSADITLMPLSMTPRFSFSTTLKRGSWRMYDAGHTRPERGHPKESCRRQKLLR